MPILMTAELHRFALGMAEERLARVLEDPRVDGGLARDAVVELVVYHRRCLVLAEEGTQHFSLDSVVHCEFAEETHGRAEMFFSTLSHDHPGDIRYDEVAWHRAMVKDAIDEDPDGLARRYFGKGGNEGGGKGGGQGGGKGGGQGVGIGAAAVWDKTHAAAFREGRATGQTKGEEKGYRKGEAEGYAVGFQKGFQNGLQRALNLVDNDAVAEFAD